MDLFNLGIILTTAQRDVIMEGKMSEIKSVVKNLGWANDWSEKPDIVKKCHELKHKRIDINHDPSMHGLHHEVRCDICGYVYHYDSSG